MLIVKKIYNLFITGGVCELAPRFLKNLFKPITMVQIKKNGWLEEEILIDAKIVLCAMRGGMDAIMAWGLNHIDLFPTTDDLTNRVFNLKKQPKLYIDAVSEKAAELEQKYTSLIP